MNQNADEHRPIPGLDGLYEVSRSGEVWSVRAGRFIAWERDDQGRPYIEVSIHQVKFERSILDAVREAWGDTSGVTVHPLPPLDTLTLQLFDHVIGTYQPTKRWGKARLYAPDAGKRGLFQIVGRIVKEDRQGCVGEKAMMPRGGEWLFHRCPISHLVDLERAPPGAGKYVPGVGLSR